MAVGTLIRLIGWGEFHFAVLRMARVGSWYRGEKIKFSNKKELVALGFVADGTVASFHPGHIVYFCVLVGGLNNLDLYLGKELCPSLRETSQK